MSHRLFAFLTLLLLFAAPPSRAQSDVYSFTANDGKFYSRIKVVRVEDDAVIYTYTQGAGGGRLKFSQLPEDIAAQFQALKPREKTFTETLPTTSAADVTEAASSNRSGNGEKSDSATLSLSNAVARALCTFSRKVSTNDINYLILITYSGSNYLGLGVADSLTFDADGALVTYSPVAGTHRVDTSDGQMSESQVYRSSLRDLEKVCSASTLGLALSGPLGAESFALPATNILKNFGRFCLANAPAPQRAQTLATNSATTTISFQPSTNASQPAQILDATARTVDDDPYLTQWGWKVTLRAPDAPPKDFLLEFQFLDGEGYVLAHEIQYPVKLTAGETNTFTGQTAIKTALTRRIKTCKVVMK